MIVSDTPNCGITYDHHYDDCNSFIVQATEKSESAGFLSMAKAS